MQNISVRFTNETPLTVGFFLNGGGGLETSLGPSASQSYTMVVDPGVQPTVGIHQPTGETLEFTVADQGDYAFRFKDGKIVNFFEAQPDGSTAAPVETCIVNLRWQSGSGFVPAWFEGDVTGSTGQYIASKSAEFNIIPGDAFWLNTSEVQAEHSKLVSELVAAGWQQIGQATEDWWSTEFRRHIR